MFLLPYRAQIKLHKLPVMTLGVMLVCLLIYTAQSVSEQRVHRHAAAVCEQHMPASGDFLVWLSVSCAPLVMHIRYQSGTLDREAHLESHLAQGQRAALGDALLTAYRVFAATAPAYLTAYLWHDRGRFDPLGMLTSSVAHGSWEHAIFNLFFFFAFAATVELVLGPVLFLAAVVLLSLGIGSFDHMIAVWRDDPTPSLGLSGVVMGMLALFLYFLPHVRIRFAFWFLLSAGTFGVPAWLVAMWYVGWDLYYQLTTVGSQTNFVAHLTGAALGLGLGVVLFRRKRHWARDIVAKKHDLTREETWLTKFNFISTSTVILPALFFGLLFIGWLSMKFVQSFGLQVLLISPVLAAGYQFYRMKRAERPVHERYRLGLQALEHREYHEALRLLAPLAEANDRRALYALGSLHAGAPGALRDEARAAEFYRRAADRGHAPAQHALGRCYADGSGVPMDIAQAMHWYERAARDGAADAAYSLAHLYESGPKTMTDREKAIEWYYRAGEGFCAARRYEDAGAVVLHLEHLAAGYPAVLGLVARLKARAAM